jgi:hypothetical protein
MQILAAIALPVFILLLPFICLWVFLFGGASADEVWMLKVSFTVLAPFSSTLWFIIVHPMVKHHRSGYGMQFLVFTGTAIVVFLMLRAGVYSL